jgi:hypothetical protein
VDTGAVTASVFKMYYDTGAPMSPEELYLLDKLCGEVSVDEHGRHAIRVWPRAEQVEITLVKAIKEDSSDA